MQKKTWALAGLLLAKIVLQFLLVRPVYELHRDEYLHLDQGRHLSWGYISVPPVTSWFSALIRFFGNSEFLVRLVPALFGAFTLYLVWKMVEEIKGGLFACLLASLTLLFSIHLRINMLYQPNSFDVFFWTQTYFVLFKYIKTQKPAWLYALGVTVAFGFLSKYNILFLTAGLFPALLLTEHRRIFATKHLYFAVFIALLIVSPNLYWQYENHFPTVAQLHELAQSQLVNVNRMDFLKDQVLFFLSGIFVVAAAFIGLIFYPPFRPYRFVVISFLVAMGLFLYFKAKNYYTVGLYPVLLPFGAVYLERLFSIGWRRTLRPISIGLLLILSIPFLWLSFPINNPAHYANHPQPYKKVGALRWEDGKDHQLPQDYADMLGWKELAQKTDSVYRQLADKEHTLVLCDNYGQAGAINYYSAFPDIRAVSFNADYINWMPLDKRIMNVILVKSSDDSDPERNKEKPLFRQVTHQGEIENLYARERGTRIDLLEGALTDIRPLLQQEINSRKTAP